MKGVLPNREIMMAYISTQYKNLKGRKHIKTNIRKSCDMESHFNILRELPGPCLLHWATCAWCMSMKLTIEC